MSGLGCNYGFRIIQVMVWTHSCPAPLAQKVSAIPVAPRAQSFTSERFQRQTLSRSLVASPRTGFSDDLANWTSGLWTLDSDPKLFQRRNWSQLKQHQKTGLVALLSVDGHPWLDRCGWFWMILHVSDSWQSLWLLLLIVNPMVAQVLIAHDPSQPPHQHPAVTLASNNHLHISTSLCMLNHFRLSCLHLFYWGWRI